VSPLKWMRAPRRSRLSSDSKSPSACARERFEGRPCPGSQIERRVVGQLEEDAAVRAALVQLAGRVEEARTEADRRRDLERVAHLRAQIVQRKR
jgi:hypothetical protein